MQLQQPSGRAIQKKTAYSIGSELLRKPELKSKISQMMKDLSMQPDEIKKRLTDMGRGDLGDYVIVRTVPYTPKVKRDYRRLLMP